MNEDQPGPRLRVVRGEATTTEVAALIAVVAAKESAPGLHPLGPHRSAWSTGALAGRPDLSPGPDAWRLSERPR